ncbi:MAG: GTPase ObgE [Bacteriovoracia bacterium]
MKFIDEAKITVQSGHGGAGCVAFRREKYVPRGGPAGGDGGKGGDVWIQTSTSLNTLLDFRYKRIYEAQDGRPGQGGNKTGSDGKDVLIQVPVGTLVKDFETNEVIVDLSKVGETFLLCKGGRGGKGNTHFASSTHQAPKFAQPGEEGETKLIRLELKLLADVGLIGYPNAGKSTLISKISAARPKIANYPFTTLVPNLGVVRLGESKDARTFVAADVPGLIEGASLGRGLGTRFLKHIDRTAVLVHMIDGAKLLKEFTDKKTAQITGTVEDVAKACVRDKEIIDAELYTHNPELLEKHQILVFNKCELFEEEFQVKLKAELERQSNQTWFLISAESHMGLDLLLEEMASRVEAKKKRENPTPEFVLPNNAQPNE